MKPSLYAARIRMLARKARFHLGSGRAGNDPRLTISAGDPAANAAWPLFQRMSLDSQRSAPHRDTPHMAAAAADVPVRVIPPEDFSAGRLFAEIAAMPETGGELHLPPGRLDLTEELRLRSGVRLIGQQGSTELVFRDTRFGIAVMGSGKPAAEVSIENIRIRHEGPHRFCAAVFATEARDLFFAGVDIIAPRAVGFLFSDRVHGARLEHCRVYRAGLAGFMMLREVSDTTLHSCTAEECLQSGVFLTDMKLPPGIDPLDFDAQIHYTNEVIGNFGPFSPGDPSPCRTTMTGCSFRRNRKMGITTDGVGYLRVVDSVIEENDCEGITLDNGSWGCQVLNCHIHGNGWRGLQHEAELNKDLVNQLGMMKDGSSKAKLPGVSLDNAAYCRIEQNCIEGNWGDGVKLVRAGYACTVARNIIANNNRGANDRFHFFGVLLGAAARQHPDQNDFPSCYNHVLCNDILGEHYAGVHLVRETSHNLIEANRIVGASFAPVEDHTITGNIVRRNGPEVPDR